MKKTTFSLHLNLPKNCSISKFFPPNKSGGIVFFLGLLLLFVLGGIYTESRFILHRPLNTSFLEDFKIYLRACQNALNGGDPYDIRAIGAAFIYPPTALIFTAPIYFFYKYLPTIAPVAQVLSSLVLLLGTPHLILRDHANAPSPLKLWAILSSIIITLFFAPTLETLHLGQINPLVILGIAAFVVFESKNPFLSGIGLAIAISIKVTPIIFLPLIIVRKNFRLLITCFAACIILATASSSIFGFGHFETYIDVLSHLPEVMRRSRNSQSLASILESSSLLGSSYMTFLQHFYTAVEAGFIAIILGREALRGPHRFSVPTLIILLVITPNIVWYHHYATILIPALIFLFLPTGLGKLHQASLRCAVLGTLILIQIDREFSILSWSHGLLTHIVLNMLIIWLTSIILLEPKKSTAP